jgi:hypothetical protein
MPELKVVRTTNTAERRRAPRRKLETRVALKTDKAIFFMESLDISSTGIRVQSEVGIEIGTRCRLVPFFDDVSRLFEASGTVVRLNEVPVEGRPGVPVQSESSRSQMGIRFDTLSPAELAALLGILSHEPAPVAAPLLVAGGRA